MKGKIILIPLKEPKEGMKVVCINNTPNIDTIDWIYSQIADPTLVGYCTLKTMILAPVPLSELQQIAVEYMDVPLSWLFNEKEQVRPSIKTLPLHPDDYEKALPLIGKEVEFKEACLIGCEAIRDHAKLITPTPVMYTGEEVLKLIENYDLFFWNNIQVATLHNDNYKPLDWWNENKKK